MRRSVPSSISNSLIGSWVLMAGLVVASTAAAPDRNPVAPGELRSYSTQNSIGIEWDVAGDANHNATCRVRYRAKGAKEWREALGLLRIDHPEPRTYGDNVADRAYNMVAGSILFLEPGTTYEVALTLVDPDGGKADKELSIATRPVPRLTQGGRSLHAVPGSGGGSGTAADPFRGLLAAETAAAPGDRILLHAGQYGRFRFVKSGTPEKYLAWLAAGDGDPVFERADVEASHLWLESLAFQRADASQGLVANGSQENVVLRRNRFTGYHYSITLRPGCRAWTITDNTIVGDKQDLAKGDISGEGVELGHSSDHVVAYNRISRVADGISYAHRNCDIFGNDIRDVTDDGVEPDYGYANIRIWGNRIHRPFYHAFSFQPQFCGPWYFVRNEVICRTQVLKPNTADRFVLVANTLVSRGRYAQGRADLLLKALSRNNLWILIDDPDRRDKTYAMWQAGRSGRGIRYSMEYQALPDWRTDLDFDGFDWDRTPIPFWWEAESFGRKQFPDLASFAAAVGVEKHGLRVRKEEIFEISDIPAYAAEPFSTRRLTLKAGCAAIDVGQALPNLCDTFRGRAPDLGAYELGDPPPHYGPRPEPR